VPVRELVWGPIQGALRGEVGRDGALDVICPHSDQPLGRGDFALALVAEGAIVLRVAGGGVVGPFGVDDAEGEARLVEAVRAGTLAELAAPAALRFRLRVSALGLLRTGERWRFEAGVRATQLFGCPVYRPSEAALSFLANVGLDEEDPAQIVRVGRLATGYTVSDIPVHFSVNRLKARRSFVFARAGYGKSNLTKLLLSRLYQSPPEVGLLIVDPEGEYAFSQAGPQGSTTPGLLDHPGLRRRAKVFTNRRVREPVAGPVKLNIADLLPGNFLASFVPAEKRGGVWANYLRAAKPSTWAELVGLLRERGYFSRDEELAAALGVRANRSKDKNEGNYSLDAIRNNVLPVIHRLDDPSSKLIDEVERTLFGLGGEEPGVVILDTSTMPARDADGVLRVLLHHLFGRAVRGLTEGGAPRRGVLLVLEEAQTVLSGRHLDDQDIYVRWVKEGRKYGLGAMLVTQQPGAIAPELVSQGDNFFVMHLLAERDLSILGEANAHFSPEILHLLRTEPVKGNCYFWSAPDQPYVVGMRVDPFEASPAPAASVAPARQGSEPAEPVEAYEARLLRAVVSALVTSGRVYLYRVESIDDQPQEGCVAVAGSYLAQNIAEAAAFRAERPDDWELRWERVVLRVAVLDALLARAGLGWRPLRAEGAVENKGKRAMVLLKEARLAELAGRLGRALRPAREGVRLFTGGGLVIGG